MTFSDTPDFASPRVATMSSFVVRNNRAAFVAQSTADGTMLVQGEFEVRRDGSIRGFGATYLAWFADGCFQSGDLDSTRLLR